MRISRLLLLAALAGTLASLGWATTVVPPTFEQLVNESDYVIRARVTSVVAERRVVSDRVLIFTNVALEVIESIAGSPPAQPVLVLLGGRMGDEEMWIEGAPRFAVGEEHILFVSGNGANFHPLYALGHGRYRVRRDASGREFVVRENGVPLEDVAEVALPLNTGQSTVLQSRFRTTARALSPAEFGARIRATRQVGGRREK